MSAALLVSLIGSLFGGLGGAIGGTLFGLRNHRSQRVWDIRAEAYSAMFSAIDGMQHWFDEQLTDLELGTETSPELDQKRQSAFVEHQKALAALLARHTHALMEFDIDDPTPLEALAKKFRVSRQTLGYRISNMR